jgi:uncharacterized protein YggU (UPF0235/DUF167 family)
MYIHVKVIAGAKKESFKKVSETQFAVSVREKAERNMANHRVIELIARQFHTPTNSVRLLSGHRSPAKVFAVDML